jgi:hypothetical protein
MRFSNLLLEKLSFFAEHESIYSRVSGEKHSQGSGLIRSQVTVSNLGENDAYID